LFSERGLLPVESLLVESLLVESLLVESLLVESLLVESLLVETLLVETLLVETLLVKKETLLRKYRLAHPLWKQGRPVPFHAAELQERTASAAALLPCRDHRAGQTIPRRLKPPHLPQ
jgi:hypothetical protein